MQSGKLVGIRSNTNKRIQLVFLPKDAQNLTTCKVNEKLYLKWHKKGENGEMNDEMTSREF
jgi:hypothetical protein